jgi:hypothetical protein
MPDAEARRQQLWDLPRQVGLHARPAPAARSVLKTASAKSEPRTLSIQVAEPISKSAEVKSVTVPAPVIKTSNQTSAGLRIPKNPLRGT